MIDHILREKLHILGYKLVKNENGKPFLEFEKASSTPIFLSVTHTKKAYFIAFCDQNVGIDAELISRETNYAPILMKFPELERLKIENTKDFLIHWTIKESAIKWLGGALTRDIKRLSFTNQTLTFCGLELPVSLYQKEFLGHFITVCSDKERDWEFISL